MGLSFDELTFLFITIAFGILTLLLLIQILIRKRYAWAFFMSIIFGLLAGVSGMLNKTFFSDIPLLSAFFESAQMNCWGFHFFCFYIFFERLISRKINSIRLSIMVILLVTQTIGLWLVFYYKIHSMNTNIGWVLADIGYWSPALFTYVGLGIPIYIKTYKYTKEIKPILLSLALISVGVGFFISFLGDLEFILDDVFGIPFDLPPFFDAIFNISSVFPFIGITLFVIVYLINIDYIYRLPNDNFILLVLRSGGTPIHTIHLRTRKQIDVKEFLLSGMITAINNVFKEIIEEEIPIERITSQGINILIRSGEYISAVIITDKVTYFLVKGLQRYINEFEVKFAEEIKRNEENIHAYDDAVEILRSVFPFFIIN